MTDIRGYDLGDQEVIDIQASQGISFSIVDGRREEVGKLSISLHVSLPTLRLRRTRALVRRGDTLILINPDPDWLVLYRVLRFRETNQNALRPGILGHPVPSATW